MTNTTFADRLKIEWTPSPNDIEAVDRLRAAPEDFKLSFSTYLGTLLHNMRGIAARYPDDAQAQITRNDAAKIEWLYEQVACNPVVKH